ncbi:MAG: 3-hydroxyacyl-CoA dehydrogenase family protein [Paracoccaceae bacterium]
MGSLTTDEADVALIGADAAMLGLARDMAAAGRRVVLVEPDAHDAARLREIAARAGLSVPVLDMARACVVLAGPGVAVPPGAVAVGEGTEGPRVILHATTGPVTLAEVLGGPLPAVEAVLGVPVLRSGGIGPRLRAALMDAADTLLLQGATPWEIDEAMVAAGFAIGPYELEDLIGLDLRHTARLARGGAWAGLAEHAAAEGRLGKKGGVGWYRYPGGGGAVIDPLVEDLIRHEAHFGGIAPVAWSDAAIARELMTVLADCAPWLVQEGVAGSVADVTRVAVAALGWPPGRPLSGAAHVTRVSQSSPKP